jgi:hypothetical protein
MLLKIRCLCCNIYYMNKKEKFNYIIGAKWPDGSLNAYSYLSTVKYGTIHDANEFLEYVKKQPNEYEFDWKIYKIIENK